MSFHYQLRVSDAELKTLGWLANHGYFPDVLYDAMHLADGEPDPDDGNVDYTLERTWLIPEYAAWSLLDLRDEDPDAYLSCLGGELLEKILQLEMEIV